MCIAHFLVNNFGLICSIVFILKLLIIKIITKKKLKQLEAFNKCKFDFYYEEFESRNKILFKIKYNL